MRSVMVGEVRTGRRITQIPVSGATWSMVHRGAGEITVGIPLVADDFRRLERSFVGGLYPGPDLFPSLETYPEAAAPVWKPGDGLRPELLSAIEPARCFLAVLEGDHVLEAGPIWAHSYDVTTGILAVKASGLRSLFDHRYVVGVVASGSAAASWSATYTGSLGTIAKRLIELAMSHAGGELPVVLPDETPGSNTRTYNGYDLGPLGARLDELMGVINGPDIAFEPRLTADRLGIEWVMRVGDPLLHQRGDDHVWDSRVPQGGVSGLSVERDATGLAQRAWVTGEGMESALLMERAEDPALLDAGFPLTEVADSRPTVGRRSTLQSHAESALRASLRPWATWSATVQASASPRLGTYRPGDWARVWVPEDHPYLSLMLPAGFHRARVLEVSGGMGEHVNLKFAPVMEAR